MLIGLTASCAPSPPASALSVAAASSLAEVFERLHADVFHPGGLDVVYTLGASGDLEAQLANGAPYDIFVSAAAANVDRLIDAGVLDPATRTVLAEGRLFLVQSDGASAAVANLAELARSDIRRIAMANPDHAPYGAAARQALQSAGVWDSIQGKVVYAETVQQAWEFVASGNADVGLVAESIVEEGSTRGWEVPLDLYSPPQYVGAVRLTTQRHEAALALLDLFTSEEGRAILDEFGLREPSGN
jgi:molybdate transport system substrate-binding protein